MKQFLLASALVLVPAAGFALVNSYLHAPSMVAASLGDLSAMKLIVGDVRKLADSSDLIAAEKRITDLETAWDDGEATLRPLNPDAWGSLDQAIDKALRALRASAPDAAQVKDKLQLLTAALDDPGAVASGPATGTLLVSGIAVTDDKGRPLPCETMLTTVRDALVVPGLATDKMTEGESLAAKATERCNADDDQRADAFSAGALAALAQK